MVRIGRTLPPAASPIPLLDILRAFPACFRPDSPDNAFEREIKEEFNSKYCFLLSSGKAALTIILLALKELYPDRDQVVIPAFTCYSVPAAVKRAGLNIHLCDLAPSSLDFDHKQLKHIIDQDEQKKILCVLPTHLFGCPADISAVREIVGPKIPIVEDAAQAMGETCNGKKLGTLGDAGFFSLGRGKALSTMGGGIIMTDRDDLAMIISSLTASLTSSSRLDNLKLFCKTVLASILLHPALFWLPKALPFLRLGETFYEPDFPLQQLSAFHIQLTRNWGKRLKNHREARKRETIYWQSKLPEHFCQVCRDHDIGFSFIRFPVLAPDRKQWRCILKQSERHGLGIMPAYPTPINMIPEIATEFSNQQYPQAEATCNLFLTLPVHQYIKERDKKQILVLLNDCNSI